MFIVMNLLYNAYLTIWSLTIYVNKYEDFKDKKWTEINKINQGVYDFFFFVGVGINLAIAFFFTVPVFLLLYVHIINFCKNMTTNERYSKSNQNQKSLKENSKSLLQSKDRESNESYIASTTDNSEVNLDSGNCFGNCK